MFARVFKSAVIVSVVAFFATARGVPTSSGNSECDNEGLKCCNQVIDVRPTLPFPLGTNHSDALDGRIVVDHRRGIKPRRAARAAWYRWEHRG
jgi:hypothetical protein